MPSFETTLGNGSNRNFTVPFPYIDRSHVKVAVNGVLTTAFTWINDGTIQTTVAPANGAAVTRYRETPKTPLVDFSNGALLPEQDLDTATRQTLYLTEEATDALGNVMRVGTSGRWGGDNRRIENVAPAVNPTDVPTLAQVQSETTGAAVASASAAASATAAAASATTASNAATNASNSATAAGNSATEAANSAASVDGPSIVRVTSQTFTGPQQTQARANIGAGPAPPFAISNTTGLQTALDAKSNILHPLTTIASGATTDLGSVTSEGVEITGNLTIASLGTAPAGTRRLGRVTGTPTFTHNATSLICLGGANIVATAGDTFEFWSLGSGNWFMRDYQRANGTALVAPAAGPALPNNTTNAVGNWRSEIYVQPGFAAAMNFNAPAGGTWAFAGITHAHAGVVAGGGAVWAATNNGGNPDSVSRSYLLWRIA